MDSISTETTFVGRSGCSVVIHRYGQDDYSAWITDDVTKDDHGCSVRGTLLDIIEEVRDEVPARKCIDESERLSIIAQYIELFEDFLDERGIDIPNDEKEQSPDSACTIYGTDFGELAGQIEYLLIKHGVLD